MSRAPRSSRKFTEYWSPYYNQSSFFFDPVSPAETEREILLIPQNKTYRLYSCPIRILTDARCVISGLRAIIMTKSVQKGVFPSKLKKAKVVPVFQNDDKPEPGNCRSIPSPPRTLGDCLRRPLTSAIIIIIILSRALIQLARAK